MSDAQFIEPTSLIRHSIEACRKHFIYLIIFSIAINLLYIAPSLFMIQVYDRVLTTGGVTTLVFLLLLLLIALATLSFLDALRARLLTSASHRLDRLLSPRILAASLAEQRLPQGVRTQFLRDFDAFRGALTQAPAIAIADAPWAAIYIGVCFLIHPAIGCLALFGSLAMAALAVLNNFALTPKNKLHDQAVQAHYALQSGDATHADLGRSLGMVETMAARQQHGRNTVRRLGGKATDAATLYVGIGKFLRLALQSGTLAMGALLAIDRLISPGSMIAASILVARAYAPIEQLIGAWGPTRRAIDTYRGINMLVARDTALHTGARTVAPRGDLAIDGVLLRAAEVRRFVLYGISLTVSPGEIVGIVGASGVGKSMLAKVMVGIIRPDDGTVRMDGMPLAQWDDTAIGRARGYVPQDIGLLAGTIADNISRLDTIVHGPSAAIDADVVAAAAACGADRMIQALPDGYNTRLGANGQGISIGQAQRIAIARALYGNPSLIVMDEPNAHLDGEADDALIAALVQARARGAAIVVIAHRASLLQVADRIAVMREGRIIDIGDRYTILARLQAPAAPPTLDAEVDA